MYVSNLPFLSWKLPFHDHEHDASLGDKVDAKILGINYTKPSKHHHKEIKNVIVIVLIKYFKLGF